MKSGENFRECISLDNVALELHRSHKCSKNSAQVSVMRQKGERFLGVPQYMSRTYPLLPHGFMKEGLANMLWPVPVKLP